MIFSSNFADDLITPVYVAPTRSPATFKPKGFNNKDNIQIRPSCDDEEDCEEGSGDPGTTEEIFVTSATGEFRKPDFYSFRIISIDFTLSHFYSVLFLSLK